MRKLFFLLLFILAAVGASARQDTLKYRISLKDKAATTYSLEHPEAFLSEKAIERRRKQNLPIDSRQTFRYAVSMWMRFAGKA